MAAESPIIDPVAESGCKNCGTALTGRFCSQCGQPDKHVDPSLHDLLHELVHEFFHLDGKIVATLKSLILRPGQLSTEFFAGRRAAYMGPIRLYLTFSVLFFLVTALQPVHTVIDGKPASTSEAQQALSSQVNKAELQGKSLRARLLRGALKASEDPELLNHKFLANASRVMFLLVPLFAVGLMLAYRNRGKHYPTFIYFSLHYHAFAFLALTIYTLASLTNIEWLDSLVALVVTIWLPVYLFIALRRAFGGTRRNTLLRMSGLAMFYFPCFIFGMAIAGIITLYTL